MVGCKADLPGRKIWSKDGQALAKKLQIDFMEISNKSGLNVDKLFKQISENSLKRITDKTASIQLPITHAQVFQDASKDDSSDEDIEVSKSELAKFHDLF